MSWDRVHEEAEVLEHAISPELSELIAAKLGNPTHDPHGDPIPTSEGEIDEPRHARAGRPRAGRARRVRARVRLRPGDAALPGGPRHRSRRRLRGRSIASPSTARSPCASATGSTCSAARSPAPCAPSSPDNGESGRAERRGARCAAPRAWPRRWPMPTASGQPDQRCRDEARHPDAAVDDLHAAATPRAVITKQPKGEERKIGRSGLEPAPPRRRAARGPRRAATSSQPQATPSLLREQNEEEGARR